LADFGRAILKKNKKINKKFADSKKCRTFTAKFLNMYDHE
jgi:hypothetical protein